VSKYFIVGGAGGIGSYFIDVLLKDSNTELITIYDNFSSGREWHYEHNLHDKRLHVIRGSVENNVTLTSTMKNHDVVIHLASNPDISKAVTQPDIDFWQGTALTNYVLEAMRKNGIKRILYASGSGVYGDIGLEDATESRGNLMPISTYGASKLAGETLINSYCHMFDMTGIAFRFANVLTPYSTHGVTLDFIKKLLSNQKELTILGDGSQSKSYIHVNDVVNAVLLANKKLSIHSHYYCNTKPFEVYNVATNDRITVTEIAELVAETLNINDVKFNYTGGDRGWKGDVTIVVLNTEKIKALGWFSKNTTKEAIKLSILEMLPNIKLNKM